MLPLNIYFIPARNGINIIFRNELGTILEKNHTYNVMNLLDNGYFNDVLNMGYNANEISIHTNGLDEYDAGYIAHKWEIVTEK